MQGISTWYDHFFSPHVIFSTYFYTAFHDVAQPLAQSDIQGPAKKVKNSLLSFNIDVFYTSNIFVRDVLKLGEGYFVPMI
jgi:hypothetical protein